MLLIYDKDTGKVISVSGVRPMRKTLNSIEKQVELVEPLKENECSILITDENVMDKVFRACDAKIDIFIDDNGEVILPESIPEPEPTSQPPPEPTLTELQAQQLAQAEAIAAIFEMLTGGEA